MTAGGRRDNCASGLPGAWLRGSATRHYIAPRSLPGVMMRRVQTALPAGQPPGISCVELAQPWVGGGSKRGSRAAAAEPGSGVAAAQQAGGGQGSDWLPVFLPASGSGCGLLGLCRIATKVTANRTARGPNVRTAGATGGKADRKNASR